MLNDSMWALLPGMLLLGFPVDWLLRGEVRFGQVEQMFLRGRARRLTPWNAIVLVVDPLRAAAGAYFLVQGAQALGREIGGSFPEAMPPLVLGAGLLIGIVAQLFTMRDPEYLLAPIGYAAGLVVMLVEPSVSAIALLLAFVALAGLRAWAAYFIAAAVACAGVGVLLMERDPVTPAVVGGVLFIPGIAGMLTGRHLMMPGR